jgi:predicted Zn-ribbon and HTH transcriptional regulator
MPDKTITISLKVCIRCGNEWIPRKLKGSIARCPKCKSPLWNTPRVRKVYAKRGGK